MKSRETESKAAVKSQITVRKARDASTQAGWAWSRLSSSLPQPCSSSKVTEGPGQVPRPSPHLPGSLWPSVWQPVGLSLWHKSDCEQSLYEAEHLVRKMTQTELAISPSKHFPLERGLALLYFGCLGSSLQPRASPFLLCCTGSVGAACGLSSPGSPTRDRTEPTSPALEGKFLGY